MHHPFWISQWFWETDCLHDDDKLVFCLFTECTGTLAGCCKTAWSKHCQQTQQVRWGWPNTKQMFLELWWVWHTSPESDVLEIDVCISSLTGLLKNTYTYTYTYIYTYIKCWCTYWSCDKATKKSTTFFYILFCTHVYIEYSSNSKCQLQIGKEMNEVK